MNNKRFTEIVSTGIIKDNLTNKVYVGVIDTELIKIMNDLYDETMMLNKRERKLRKDYVELQKKFDKAIDELISDNVKLQAKYNKAIDEIIYIGD